MTDDKADELIEAINAATNELNAIKQWLIVLWIAVLSGLTGISISLAFSHIH